MEYKSKYTTPDPVHVVEPEIDHNGVRTWHSIASPSGYCVRACAELPSDLPGLVIFVHGVNSEGEWYDKAEAALCEGLNERLGRTLTNHQGEVLIPAVYYTKRTDPLTGEPVTVARYQDTTQASNSPVIRFYWGWRPETQDLTKYRIPLRNDAGDDFHALSYNEQQWIAEGKKAGNGPYYWGGGPFQNGTNSLPQLWDERGFSATAHAAFVPVSIELLNTQVDRQLADAPSRRYYVHAADRLAELIRDIRKKYPKDTVTIMSHSQGTMVALAAVALLDEDQAPDALFLMNSPYALEDKVTDTLSSGDNRATEQARKQTLLNLVQRVGKRKDHLKKHNPDDHLIAGCCVDDQGLLDAWNLAHTHKGVDDKPIPERDNHGRTYIYFNPHDRVMGSSPLQSIGWQGLPNNDTGKAVLNACQGMLYQRMLARSTPCGAAPNANTRFGALPGNAGEEKSEFWTGNESVILGLGKLWAVPNVNQTVNINAEEVPQPLAAEDMHDFDEIRAKNTVSGGVGIEGPGWGQMKSVDGKLEPVDGDFKYFASIYEPKTILDPTGAKGPYGNGRRSETPAETKKRIAEYIPEPTDHSTLPGHPLFMSQVAAYDLPIGFCDAGNDLKFMTELRAKADWTSTSYPDPYMKTGELKVSGMPGSIVNETVADQIEKQKRYQGA